MINEMLVVGEKQHVGRCGRCCFVGSFVMCVFSFVSAPPEMNDEQPVITDGYGFRPFLMEIIMSRGA